MHQNQAFENVLQAARGNSECKSEPEWAAQEGSCTEVSFIVEIGIVRTGYLSFRQIRLLVPVLRYLSRLRPPDDSSWEGGRTQRRSCEQYTVSYVRNVQRLTRRRMRRKGGPERDERRTSREHRPTIFVDIACMFSCRYFHRLQACSTTDRAERSRKLTAARGEF